MKKWVLIHPYLSHIPTEDINTDVAMETIRTITVEVDTGEDINTDVAMETIRTITVEVDTGEDINTDVAMETIRTITVEVDIMKDRTKSFIVAKSYVLNIPGKGH